MCKDKLFTEKGLFGWPGNEVYTDLWNFLLDLSMLAVGKCISEVEILVCTALIPKMVLKSGNLKPVV
jgi:hypothetical protein